MVMIGTDSHKRTVRANTDRNLQLLSWAVRFEAVTFALEDWRH